MEKVVKLDVKMDSDIILIPKNVKKLYANLDTSSAPSHKTAKKYNLPVHKTMSTIAIQVNAFTVLKDLSITSKKISAKLQQDNSVRKDISIIMLLNYVIQLIPTALPGNITTTPPKHARKST